ncbi:MAG: right-handed parallel beta-helix repeat-containing protein, partial [Acidobacteria bacterium]|nr:right-handed parallel beta-helix repeat-containing protein [Acidobacteriota bacterium]
NIGITPVDTTKAYAFGSVQAGSGQNVGRSNYAGDDIVGVGSFTAELSTSQLTLTRDNTAAASNVGWFVVHWGSAPPTGTTYYVRTDGSDSNTGLSNDAAGAWLTIQKAADTMVAGDTVRVQPGTYPEAVTPLNAGTAANPITYLAVGAVVVDGGNVRCRAFDVVGTGYQVIDGFEITDQIDCGESALNVLNSDNVTIRNNIIHDTGRDGFAFQGTSANGLVENNLIYNIDDDGATPSGAGGHVFRNNTFAGTMGGWVLEEGHATNLFEDNIFWTGAIQNTALGTFNYNDYNSAVLPGTGNISSDPLFVSGYYLSHLAAGQGSDSPAIDAGSDTAANLGLDTRTTRTDSVTDTGTVDLGYHYLP